MPIFGRGRGHWEDIDDEDDVEPEPDPMVTLYRLSIKMRRGGKYPLEITLDYDTEPERVEAIGIIRDPEAVWLDFSNGSLRVADVLVYQVQAIQSRRPSS